MLDLVFTRHLLIIFLLSILKGLLHTCGQEQVKNHVELPKLYKSLY